LALALGLTGSGIATAGAFEAAAAPDYYVAPNGDDSNPGTRDRPFATLPRAFDEGLGPGDVVNLEPGTYDYGQNFLYIRNEAGDPDDPIVVNGNGATFRFDRNGQSRSGFRIVDCAHIEFRNIRATGAGRQGFKVVRGNRITFRNAESDNNYFDGVYLQECSGCLI
jgi:hypothetical protein